MYACLHYSQLLKSALGSELDETAAYQQEVESHLLPQASGHEHVPGVSDHLSISRSPFLASRPANSLAYTASVIHSSDATTDDSSILSARSFSSTASSQTCDLFSEQKEAAWDFSKPVVRVTAGPGSGKTRVLVARVQTLVQQKHVQRGRIAVITYSRKAADTLVDRIQTAVPGISSTEQEMFVGTFHKLSSKLLQ